MLKALLKNDRLIILIAPVIMVLGVTIKIATGLEPLHADSIFYLSFIQSWPLWLNYSLGAIVALASGFAANQAVQNLGILGRISNFPNLFTVLLFFMLPEESGFFYLWVVYLLQLAILRWVEQIPDAQKKLSYFVFNASMVVGILALLEGWALLYFFLVVQSMAAVGVVTIRRLIIGLLGLITPIYFYNALLYLFEGAVHIPSFELSLDGILLPFERQSISAFMFIAFMLFMGFASLYGNTSSTTLRVRRRWMIVVSSLIISAFIVLNAGYRDLAIFMLLPSSIVLAKVLITIKNQRLGALYLIVFLVLLFFYNT